MATYLDELETLALRASKGPWNGDRNSEADEQTVGDYIDAADPSTILELIQRLREAERWQPIDTAPKDGTRILAWVKGRPLDDNRCIVEWVEVAGEGQWAISDNKWFRLHPTHWMPLPEPPKD